MPTPTEFIDACTGSGATADRSITTARACSCARRSSRRRRIRPCPPGTSAARRTPRCDSRAGAAICCSVDSAARRDGGATRARPRRVHRCRPRTALRPAHAPGRTRQRGRSLGRGARTTLRGPSDVLAQRAASVRGTQMVGAAVQARRVEDDRLGERLWNGISRVRVNLGTAIVGTPEQVAAELEAYAALGFEEFILSGFRISKSASGSQPTCCRASPPSPPERIWRTENGLANPSSRGIDLQRPGTRVARLHADRARRRGVRAAARYAGPRRAPLGLPRAASASTSSCCRMAICSRCAGICPARRSPGRRFRASKSSRPTRLSSIGSWAAAAHRCASSTGTVTSCR